ncbi:aldehyde dehydrogenase family protein [Lentzea flava]|uniref:aldehyde dehydrogenase family protein n=1 Tax=Lentzea flava TaxID=103732 RepID=UPI001E53395A|nr:aldehyde dehydrogenase family protein [Lentzea flava]
MTLEEHERRVSLSSGVALPVVREASRRIAETAAQAEATAADARPRASVQDWRNVRDAGAVWVRRGEVLAVLAPGNHPAVHAAWLEALGLGYRVAVRPSQREPFTPHRLVSALRASGFGNDQVVLLPCDHVTADVLVDAADRALVYGGYDVAATYTARSDVLVQGPGRSKVLLAQDDWRDHVGTTADSISGFGGTACVNASAVLVEGDAAAVAKELARRLGELPVFPPLHENAVLPASPSNAHEQPQPTFGRRQPTPSSSPARTSSPNWIRAAPCCVPQSCCSAGPPRRRHRSSCLSLVCGWFRGLVRMA